MGTSMLVCLSGQDAQRAMGSCEPMLDDPCVAPAHADRAAGWPGDDTPARLALIIQGLVCGNRPARRMPFGQALAELEELVQLLPPPNEAPNEGGAVARVGASAAGPTADYIADRAAGCASGRVAGHAESQAESAYSPGRCSSAAMPPSMSAKECMICMCAPRGVRFACGHCVCCEACTDDLIATENQRVPQNKCPTCRARVVVAGRGSNLAFEATFVEQSAPPPPPVDAPTFRMATSAVFHPGPHRTVRFLEEGLTGLHIRNFREAPDRTVICGLTPGSPAEELDVPLGSEILAVNGHPIPGKPRAFLLELMSNRPLSMTICTPAADATADSAAALPEPPTALTEPPPDASASRASAIALLQSSASGHLLEVTIPQLAQAGQPVAFQAPDGSWHRAMPPAGLRPGSKFRAVVSHSGNPAVAASAQPATVPRGRAASPARRRRFGSPFRRSAT